MGAAQPSMQELIRRRRRAGFVGRRDELAAFRANFDVPLDDERHRFLFHVHGHAGVGKTFLVRELEQLARERGALTAYVDETVGSVPEAMAELATRFAAQGHRLKDLERRLTAHRERRHEAEAAAALPAPAADEPAPTAAPPAPSAGSMAAARAGLVGLGLVPGVGAFAGAVDAAQLAHGADRLRAGLSARLRTQDDVQLVMTPEKVLTPVLLTELADVAQSVPWIVLFFDTYERTGPFLDAWLHDLMTTDRYGALPANIVVVTAGQRPLDTARWGGYAEFAGSVPLGPFTEDETRGLLAAKGVTGEDVVGEVLRLTGGLPVLVSTLADGRPAGPEEVGDPSPTAVERFLKWERDDTRRAVALACALPRRLDADVFRAAVGCAEGDAAELYDWLRRLAFVSDRGDGVQYHGVVRSQMLRLVRHQSPRDWAERHGRLADVFAGWRRQAEVPLKDWEFWSERGWLQPRTAESYHRLCADPRAALPDALRLMVDAVDEGEAAARGWAQMLTEAGEDAGARTVATWGRDLLAGLEADGTVGALGLLLDRTEFDAPTRGLVRMLRGRELRKAGEYERAVAEYDRAVELDPEQERALYGRARTRVLQDRAEEALADLDRAVELAPDDGETLFRRGEARWLAGGRDAEALADVERSLEIGPPDGYALALKGHLLTLQDRNAAALEALDEALALDSGYGWALLHRSRVHRKLGDTVAAWADLDQAVTVAPESAWFAQERADRLRLEGRLAEAVAECDRALRLDESDAMAYASRGAAHLAAGDREQAMTDLTRALELRPGYVFALVERAGAEARGGRLERALADLAVAIEAAPADPGPHLVRGDVLREAERYAEALPSYEKALELGDTGYATHACRADCLDELGRTQEALQALDQAVELAPAYLWALVRRSQVLRFQGEFERAGADMERAVALEPGSCWVTSQEAELLRLQSRHEEAIAVYDRALALDGDHTIAHAGRGVSLYALDRDAEALEALDRALAASPDHGWALRWRGEVHRYLGHFEEAVADADGAVAAEPGSEAALRTRVRISMAVGRLDLARADLAAVEALPGLDADGLAQTVRDRAEIHLVEHRPDDALHELARLEGSAATGRAALHLRSVALRMSGHLYAARSAAVELRALDEESGIGELALTTGLLEDLSRAGVWWRQARALSSGKYSDLLVAAAMADWPAADAALGSLLALPRAFDDLAEAALELRTVAESRGADRARLLPRIARLERARDELRDRFAG
ncbi:tetratricopeptide repeat protein [Streptomyces sp. NPDC050400]|uniref:tetratricopeptide repeat protein n=1 Tax=Streptomyces sp. NPDC050400 TaxID=3365610 RepID=UPI0037B5F477